MFNSLEDICIFFLQGRFADYSFENIDLVVVGRNGLK